MNISLNNPYLIRTNDSHSQLFVAFFSSLTYCLRVNNIIGGNFMANMLIIQAHPKTEDFSYSLTVADSFITTYKEKNPKDNITIRNVYTDGVPPINDLTFDAWLKLKQANSHDLTSVQQEMMNKHHDWLEEFINHDKYVFVNPMYNHFLPAEMKQYIDLVSVARKTFKYTEDGLVGLLPDRKAVHIQAAGGYYHPDHQTDLGAEYLKNTLNRFGCSDIDSIYIEGMSAQPEKAVDILNAAKEKAKLIANTF